MKITLPKFCNRCGFFESIKLIFKYLTNTGKVRKSYYVNYVLELCLYINFIAR